MTSPETVSIDDEALKNLLDALQRARAEIGRAVIGQTDVIEQLLIGLLCEGHVLLEGAPGVGKTLLVRMLGAATGLQFSRIQFTPDLMPADVTGNLALSPDDLGRPHVEFQPGPIFTQLLLADEINRATPRTQSALLEAMQERMVTAGGKTRPLPRPFFVLATQNPLEMDGTYQLPEAQIDRFLMKSIVTFPAEDELDRILDLTTGADESPVSQVLTADDLIRGQKLVRSVPIASHVRRPIARFVRATQPDLDSASADVKKYVRLGVSPRGAQALVLSAKGHALLNGRFNVSFDDLRAVLSPALRHRFHLTYDGEAAGIDSLKLLKQTFEIAVRSVA